MDTKKLIDEIKLIAKWIDESDHFVAFTGAGISTPSGLPDYRGPDGVWTRRDKGLKPNPVSKPWSEFNPNPAHIALVELQKMGYLKFLISQNVDGLHLKSGIDGLTIAELHGNSTLLKCINCDFRYRMEELKWDVQKYGRGYRTQVTHPDQPICLQCKGRLINTIVNFGDPMPLREMEEAHNHSEHADLFVVVGSSLVVHPAASFPSIAKRNGAKLVIINKGETPADTYADILLDADCSDVLPQIVSILI